MLLGDSGLSLAYWESIVEELELVGMAEISALLGVAPNTVTSWRQRNSLPSPRWHLKAGPVWLASDIRGWYEREKGAVAIDTPPDRISTAVDLSADPGHAEVFAHYGFAMVEAQMVEEHLGTVLGLLGMPEPYAHEMFIDIVERAHRRTMGQLTKELRRAGAPLIGADRLRAVVEKRNLIVHRYFRDPDRSVKMTTDAGRLQLITELDAAARQFHLTTQHLRSAEISLALKHGVSGHTIMARIRQHKDGGAPSGSLAERAAYLVR